MAQLFALTGKIASGKDTVGSAVAALLPGGATHLSFADTLREELQIILKAARGEVSIKEAADTLTIDESRVRVAIQLWGADAKDESISPWSRTDSTRRVLQFWGTEVRRAMDADYWVKKGIAAARVHLARGENVYFSDVRFPNEALALLKEGAYLVRLHLEADEQLRRLRRRDGNTDPSRLSHISETALDSFEEFSLIVANTRSARESAKVIVEHLPK